MIISPALVIDLESMFSKQFGSKPYVLPKEKILQKGVSEFTPTGSLLREQYLGVEIFLPIKILDESGTKLLMYLPYCVLRISGKNSYISTPMIDRAGSVKELYSSEDYKIVIKGFLIGADRKFPEAELKALNDLKNKTTSVILDNAITNIFLTDPKLQQDEQRRVIIMDFDLPEVQGGREHVRPFTLTLESDTVFDLELL